MGCTQSLILPWTLHVAMGLSCYCFAWGSSSDWSDLRTCWMNRLHYCNCQGRYSFLSRCSWICGACDCRYSRHLLCLESHSWACCSHSRFPASSGSIDLTWSCDHSEWHHRRTKLQLTDTYCLLCSQDSAHEVGWLCEIDSQSMSFRSEASVPASWYPVQMPSETLTFAWQSTSFTVLVDWNW